jgi:hypothetical protein
LASSSRMSSPARRPSSSAKPAFMSSQGVPPRLRDPVGDVVEGHPARADVLGVDLGRQRVALDVAADTDGVLCAAHQGHMRAEPVLPELLGREIGTAVHDENELDHVAPRASRDWLVDSDSERSARPP